MEKKIDIDKILPLVQRPARYIAHEWNAVHKGKKDVNVCLCFPDLYEVGGSNLGIEILYHLVNARADAVAERCYAPAGDMEKVLAREGLPLFSLESHSPLADFDIVGFSLQYELCATNVLHMLHLAGIPLFSAQRTAPFPLVVGGGPMAANPEPLADFFDAFVLGEGEEALNEIIDRVKTLKQRGADRKEILRALAQIDGVYVPSLYDVTYREDGTVRCVEPKEAGVPAAVRKRAVPLEESFFPPAKIVPFLQTVHNRLTIEVARGCPGRCRFCQASKYYAPWRVRPVEKVFELTEQGLAATGFEEVSYASLSCTDYRGLEQLLAQVTARFGAKRISISLPSLRCDRFSLEVAGHLGQNKRSSLTFAPEAGTDRLRRVIGKYLPQEHIEETLTLAWKMGWRQIKLYFMVGLPTETSADVEGINQLVRAVRRKAPGLNFNVTVSPFVPKAQTAFQWTAMTDEAALRERIVRLRRTLPASVKSHFIESSLLEGVLARGDRRLGRGILRAWEKGCRFDQWKEQCKYDVWREAFKETGIDAGFYLFRERAADEVLPWDHLVFGASKENLRAEYGKAHEDTVVETAFIRTETAHIPAPPGGGIVPTKTIQRLRLRFARRGLVRFLSHLEQIEVFRRTLRRADLPLSYTAGFSPQPRISFGPAVSVGHESESEYIEIEMASRMDVGELQARVNTLLPTGYELLSVKRVPVFFPSLDALLNVADYRLDVEVPRETIDAFLVRPEIIIEKRKEDRVQRIDAKPLIRECRADGGRLFLSLRFGPKRNVKPEKILQAMLGWDDDRIKIVPVIRTGLFIEKKDGTITEP